MPYMLRCMALGAIWLTIDTPPPPATSDFESPRNGMLGIPDLHVQTHFNFPNIVDHFQ